MGNIIQVDNSAFILFGVSKLAGIIIGRKTLRWSRKPAQALDIISSVKEEQSVPQPYSCKIFKINGLGVAFTRKIFFISFIPGKMPSVLIV